jgi:ketosteroid isomerase-like protein
LASLFTEDGFVLPGGHTPVRGRQNIQSHYTGHGGPLSLRALHFEIEGSHGFIIGAYTSKPGDSDAGKFTLTLRKNPSGRWLIVSDMDNDNRPRPSQGLP